jgi:hypothetical protein
MEKRRIAITPLRAATPHIEGSAPADGVDQRNQQQKEQRECEVPTGSLPPDRRLRDSPVLAACQAVASDEVSTEIQRSQYPRVTSIW